MAQQLIFVGATANDNTGDTLRDAMVKINTNFSELYTRHNGSSDNFTVPYGGAFALSATNSSQFAYANQLVEFAITTTISTSTKVQVVLSAPSVNISGAEGPVVIQRVVDGVGTDIHGIIVSSLDNGYHLVYDDIHGQVLGTVITYKLFNRTGSGVTAGTVEFLTAYGFQFGGREV
jgi:hypothetical protein